VLDGFGLCGPCHAGASSLADARLLNAGVTFSSAPAFHLFSSPSPLRWTLPFSLRVPPRLLVYRVRALSPYRQDGALAPCGHRVCTRYRACFHFAADAANASTANAHCATGAARCAFPSYTCILIVDLPPRQDGAHCTGGGAPHHLSQCHWQDALHSAAGPASLGMSLGWDCQHLFLGRRVPFPVVYPLCYQTPASARWDLPHADTSRAGLPTGTTRGRNARYPSRRAERTYGACLRARAPRGGKPHTGYTSPTSVSRACSPATRHPLTTSPPPAATTHYRSTAGAARAHHSFLRQFHPTTAPTDLSSWPLAGILRRFLTSRRSSHGFICGVSCRPSL